jgi:hypothetical protein
MGFRLLVVTFAELSENRREKDYTNFLPFDKYEKGNFLKFFSIILDLYFIFYLFGIFSSCLFYLF